MSAAGQGAEARNAKKPKSTKNPKGSSNPAAGAKTRPGLLERIFSLFSSIGDPDYEKRRLLREIGKRLRKAKQRFYNPKKEQALPQLAAFFYELYRILAAARNLVERAESSGVLRSMLVESAFDETQRETLEGLREEAIVARVKEASPKELAGQLKEDLVSLIASFDSAKVRQINQSYNQLMDFLELVHFDYYFFLRKFDSSLVEGNLTGKPRFEAINGSYVVEDLKELWDLVLGVDLEADWDALFDVLKAYRDLEVVPRSEWKQMARQLASLRRSRVLELMIKHLAKDPFYKPEPTVHHERIVDGYFQKLKTQTELVVQKIIRSRRDERIEQLAVQVFGTAAVSRLNNYNEKSNIAFQKKMISGYTRVQPLNYVKAFLLDFFKKDVRGVVDLMLIRGQWSTQILSNQLSEAFHSVLGLSDSLIKFDESLGEDGDLAVRIRTTMHKTERDKSQMPQLRKMVHEINEMARGIIVETVQSLLAIGKALRTLIEDYGRTPPDLIMNWKELDTSRDGAIKEDMVNLYKQLYYFIQLMQFFVK
jgi:hypothetical protein